MEGAIIFAVGMLIGMVCYYIHVRYIRGEEIMEKEQQEEPPKKRAESGVPGLEMRTKDLLIETLQQMNCQVQIPDDDGEGERVYFSYQGGSFIAYASNKGLMVDVVYPQWYEHDVYDIDGFSNVRRLINDVNGYSNVTIFYYIDEEEERVHVHSRRRFLFSTELIKPEIYLRSMLDDFFPTRQQFMLELSKIDTKEELKREKNVE